ncbi:ABC transporter ATP-binding protein [Paenibacillus naphthalenovorans]|uniref:ABC transporter ATP-binding protein n=1 Tax=Paenibacillus naphthalenovorans TaxID=162209 RepID=UPI0020C8A971|nr:ABC transporter ATP-binding protein [Paenibacillus naphthalenovorans]
MVVLNVSQHRKAIERMYTDRATISRHIEIQKPSGETVLTPDPIPVYTDQPCYLSQTGFAKNDQTEAQNDIQYEAKLFIAPELIIQQGDIVAVTRGSTGRIWVYTAGEPFPPYSTHQEISLQREGYA